MKRLKIQLAIIVVVTLLSCTKSTNNSPQDPPVILEDKGAIATINNKLAWDLFNEETAAKPDKNVLISPFSIVTALAMANNGAGGNTLAEMLKTMHCSGCDVQSVNQQLKNLTSFMTKESGHPYLTITNGYFFDKSRINLESQFVNKLTTEYNCAFKEENFTIEQQSLDNINNWVATQTNGKINGILEKIGPLDVAFFINALHFKADWSLGFSQDMTSENNFTNADGTVVKHDFVQGSRMVPIAFKSGFMMVDIPFKDSTYSMSLITSSGQTPTSKLTDEIYQVLQDNLVEGNIFLSFPKMNLNYRTNLIPSLRSLGMIDAFNAQKADFTAMGTSSENLFINQAIHKAVLEVDEKGAEGAAVTSLGVGVTEMPPAMIFNKPYYLVIRNIETNTLLFIAYVGQNP